MPISLQKGQRITLTKDGANALKRVIFGVGWDAAVSSGGGFFGFGRSTAAAIDLDASCVMFNSAKQVVDTVWYRQLKSKDGSIVHTGDNLTGEGDGDDEQIIVDLTRVPDDITSIIFTVNSFSGQNFSDVANAYCRIVDAVSNTELAKLDLSCQVAKKAIIMTKLYRHNNGWKLQAIDEGCDGQTWKALVPKMLPFL